MLPTICTNFGLNGFWVILAQYIICAQYVNKCHES